MADRTLVYMNVDELLDAPTNASGHDDELIAESFDRFGFIETIVLDEHTGKLIAGHGRRDQLRRAREAGGKPPDGIKKNRAGHWLAPVTRGWASENDEEAEAAAIVLNRAGERGGWLNTTLAESLQRIAKTPAKLKGTGFAGGDLRRLLDKLNKDDERLHGDSKPKLGAFEFKVIVTCAGEKEQAQLVERLEADGYACQPVML